MASSRARFSRLRVSQNLTVASRQPGVGIVSVGGSLTDPLATLTTHPQPSITLTYVLAALRHPPPMEESTKLGE